MAAPATLSSLLIGLDLVGHAGEESRLLWPQRTSTQWLAHQFNAAGTDERREREPVPDPFSEVFSVPANPVPIELFAGNGDLGRALGIKPESGIRFGGYFVSEVDHFLAGSFAPNQTFGNGIAVLQLEANQQTLLGIKDSKISVAGLQFNGSPVNFYSGSIQGFNDLPSTPPYNRTELYTYWFSKGFPSNRLFFRVGKMVANTLFNNVVLGNQDHPSRAELSVSGLTYTPLFTNPTLYNRMPSGYNAALGLTMQLFPKAKDVVAVLEELTSLYPAPTYARSDNGPEFIAHTLRRWSEKSETKRPTSSQDRRGRTALPSHSIAGSGMNSSIPSCSPP